MILICFDFYIDKEGDNHYFRVTDTGYQYLNPDDYRVLLEYDENEDTYTREVEELEESIVDLEN